MKQLSELNITGRRWGVTNGALVRVTTTDRRPIVICGVHRIGSKGGEAEGDVVANAYLISASPDLYQELYIQVRNCPTCKGSGEAVDVLDLMTSDGPHEKKACGRCSGARRALAKAAGASS